MRYYGNVITTTIWRLYVTMETLWLQQNGGYALLWKRYDNNKTTNMAATRYYGNVMTDVFYIFNSTVVDWTCFFFRKSCRVWGKVKKKNCSAVQATDDNMTHVHCMLDTWWYKHTLSICNIYGFSTATMVAGTRVNGTLYVQWPFGSYKHRVRERFVFATGIGFTPSTSIFPCQYVPTNAPRSSSSTRCSHRLEKRAKTGSLTKKKVLFRKMVRIGKKSTFFLFSVWRARLSIYCLRKFQFDTLISADTVGWDALNPTAIY